MKLSVRAEPIQNIQAGPANFLNIDIWLGGQVLESTNALSELSLSSRMIGTF